MLLKGQARRPGRIQRACAPIVVIQSQAMGRTRSGAAHQPVEPILRETDRKQRPEDVPDSDQSNAPPPPV